jgi:hypothetical protein
MNLKDALEKAFSSVGKTLHEPAQSNQGRVVTVQGAKGQLHKVSVNYGKTIGQKVTPPKKRLDKANQSDKKKSQSFAERNIRIMQPIVTKPFAEEVKKFTMPATKNSLAAPKEKIAKVSLDSNAKYWTSDADQDVPLSLLDLDLSIGCKESDHKLVNSEVHEMALGLDFGTSTVKVVIGDLASDKSYAVPFLNSHGLNAYLLPSRVYESSADALADRKFNLEYGELGFRDLKLSLLANPDSIDRQIEVIAFLSLVIKRARAWFFHANRSIYKRVKCIWQLRIGLPAASALENEFMPLWEKVIRAAWQLAAHEHDPTRLLVLRIRNQVFSALSIEEDLEVQVIPEIAAQIFGFVVSTSFDKKAANRFLMVDVGAGTVDASLFKVFPVRGGKWNFEFYTAVVQPYGVANLHAHRVDWWLRNLDGIEASQVLISELRSNKFVTDFSSKLPEKNSSYFTGVHFKSDNPDSADAEFFDKKLMAQVQGSTLWRAVHDGFLSKADMKDTPMFLCGGGSRSSFYLELEKKLQNMPGYSWLSTEAWQLGFPRDLVAAEVAEVDFDRLSVAYGLSRVSVGQITQALPLPKVPIETQQSFTDRYVDKDQT